jgi:hypothetical protein
MSFHSLSDSSLVSRLPFSTIGDFRLALGDGEHLEVELLRVGEPRQVIGPISSAPPSTFLPGTRSLKLMTRPPTRLRASMTVTS